LPREKCGGQPGKIILRHFPLIFQPLRRKSKAAGFDAARRGRASGRLFYIKRGQKNAGKAPGMT